MRHALARLLAAPLPLGAALSSRAWAADGPAGAGEDATGLPQLDATTYASQVFWLLVTFALLYLLMDRVFLPRLGGVIEERRNRIADDYDQAAEFSRQAEDAQTAYDRSLADAKARAASISAETRAAIDADIKEMEAESDARLEGEIAAAEASIRQTAEAARAAVQTAAREATADIVEALTGRRPDPSEVDAALAQAQEPAARAA